MDIRDGTGTGNMLKVDDENMAHTLAVSASEQHYVNDAHGEAYSMDIDGITTDAANYWLAIIKNTDDTPLHITSITLAINAYTADAWIEAFMGGTFVYAANGTAVVPTNRNAGSGKTATGLFYVNDGTGNITTVVSGSVAGRYRFTAIPEKWVFSSHLILPKNSCFMLQQAKSGEVMKGYISFYYHNDQWL